MTQTTPIKYPAAESTSITTRLRGRTAATDTPREAIQIDVLNAGAHAVRVRSQTHFFEADRSLKFDRAAAFGMRLDRPAGSCVRFEAGEIVRVRLVRMARALEGETQSRTAGYGAGEVRQRRLRSVIGDR